MTSPTGGTLFVTATPVGNLGDLTDRAREILRGVAAVACEDTRVTSKLLARIEATPRLISVREANEEKAAGSVLAVLREGGDVAYCSDAGTPGVSDPGARLVRAVRAAGFPVVPVPGPSAVMAALSASGLPADRFLFAGFLPPKKTDRQAALAAIRSSLFTIVLFEAPHRAEETLAELSSILGGDRKVVICRELTKLHEEIIETTLGEGAARGEWRGELTLVIAGREDAEAGEAGETGLEAARAWMKSEAGRYPWKHARELSDEAAAVFGIGRKEAYAMALEVKGKR